MSNVFPGPALSQRRGLFLARRVSAVGDDVMSWEPPSLAPPQAEHSSLGHVPELHRG
jgi:hypothetical protein